MDSNYESQLALDDSYWEQVHDKEGQTYGGGTQEKALPQQPHNQSPREPHWTVMNGTEAGTCISHT